ncbi:MAG: LamG-like jellyroll fold domain-containing protein, partial [Patescibacteria group bacterium]|nr:LamG-like jellyroll fold domain-containing protein [Patescibacteria group bacterium]
MRLLKQLRFGVVFLAAGALAAVSGEGLGHAALIASWDFHEGSGASAAANEGGIDAAVLGSYGSGSQPTWVAGALVPGATDNSALHFNSPTSNYSNGGYAAVSTDSVFNFGVEGNFSVAVWLKMPQPTGTTGLVNTLGSGSLITGWGLVAFSDGRVQFELNPGGGARAISSTASTLMNSGEWFHLAATYQGGNTSGNSTAALTLYLNGQQVATNTVNFGGNYSSDAFPDNDLHFGAYANLTRFLQGSLDGVRIYDHVLSGSEVEALLPDTYTWTGGTGVWNLPSNWDPSGVPGSGEVAAIGAGGIATISDTRSVGHVTVAGGASLRLQGGVTVTGKNLSLVGGTSIRGELRNVSGNNVWLGPIAVQPGQAVVQSDAGTLTLSGPVTLANTTHGKLLAVGNGNVIISGNISGGANAADEAVATSGGFSGTLTLSGTNTYVGHTRINNGTLSVAGGSAIPDASRVWLFGTGRLNLQANETIGSLDSTDTNTQVTLNAHTLTVGGDGTNRSFAGAISGTGGVTKIGAGIQTLKGSGIAYQGNTAVSGGRLVFEDATNFGNNQPGPTTMAMSNGSTLEFKVGAGKQQNVGLAGQVTISGNGSLVKSGDGTLALGGQHSYSGDTILEGGTLTLQGGVRVGGSSLWLDASDSASLMLSSSNTVTQWNDRSGNGRNAVAGGLSQPLVTNNPLVGGLEVVRFNGTNQILNVDLSFLAGSEYTIFAVEGRTSSRTMNYFLGTPTPSPNNGLHVGYLDNTTYRLAQHANDLDYTGLPGYTSQEFRVWSNLLDSDSGHAIYLNGANPVSNSNTVALITANNGRIGAGQRSENVQWFHGDLGEILIFNHALSSTERQAMEAYLLRKWILGLSDTNVLPADTHLRIAGGATLDLAGINQTVASLANHGGVGGSVINSGISTATLNVAGSATTEFSGTLADGAAGGSLGLTHGGSGTLTLSGNNTYTGATTVLGGTLAVNGTLSGTSGVVIGPDGTLGGSGVIAATVSGAGLISPGNSAGILTVDSIAPSDGMSFAFEFGRQGSPAYANAADSINDVLRLTDSTGPFESDLGVGNTVDVYLGVEDLAWGREFRGGFYTDRDQDFLGSIEDATFNYYILGDGDGAYEFNGQAYYSLAESWPTWSFDLATVPESAAFAGGSANGYVMQLTAVPEPGTLALFACGLLGLL